MTIHLPAVESRFAAPALEPTPLVGDQARFMEPDSVGVPVLVVKPQDGSHCSANRPRGSAFQQQDRLARLNGFQACIRAFAPAPLGALGSAQDALEMLVV